MSQSSSPIADLSYRHYDGPLNAPVARWWSIAKMTIQVAIKKKILALNHPACNNIVDGHLFLHPKQRLAK